MLYNLQKTATANRYLIGALGAGTLGSLYGIGDTEHNYKNDIFHRSTYGRGAQGTLAGLAGVGGYSLLRGMGQGRLASGLAALLSAGGAAALAKPKLSPENPYSLPF